MSLVANVKGSLQDEEDRHRWTNLGFNKSCHVCTRWFQSSELYLQRFWACKESLTWETRVIVLALHSATLALISGIPLSPETARSYSWVAESQMNPHFFWSKKICNSVIWKATEECWYSWNPWIQASDLLCLVGSRWSYTNDLPFVISPLQVDSLHSFTHPILHLSLLEDRNQNFCSKMSLSLNEITKWESTLNTNNN